MPPSPRLIISKDHFFTFEEGISKEWLITNGRGAYAASTVIGANSRRYHGLLIASFPPHLHRLLVLSKVEEAVSYAGEEFYLGVNRYPNTIHPQGHRHLISFRQDPFPVFTYQLKDAWLEKEIFMPRGQNAVVIFYRLLHGRGPISLRLYPFLQCRNHHHLRREDLSFSRQLQPREKGFLWSFPTLPQPLKINAPDTVFTSSPDWYYNLQYDRERERGFDFEEDCYCPGFFEGQVNINGPLSLWASCPPPEDTYSTPQIEKLYQKEKAEILEKLSNTENALAPSPRPADAPLPAGEGPGVKAAEVSAAAEKYLILAAENFKGRDQAGNPIVIAGYPWFGFWGRDALVALPGLFLTGQDFEGARELLLYLARHCRKGLIPKDFSEADGTPNYASADTSLWFIHALHQYYLATDDASTLKSLLPVVKEILNSYQQGTDYGIKMDADGLIRAESPGLPLTWMDTPSTGEPEDLRAGRAVEVNALWYNALCAYEELQTMSKSKTRRGDRPAAPALTRQVKESFNRLFWDPRLGYLYDVLGPQGPDGALRPNQIFSLSLPFPVLEEQKWKPVFDLLWRELYTPWGLRTLTVSHPNYRGRYQGNHQQREEAYHQGTVWPWLLGPFFTAFFRIHGRTPDSLKLAGEMLEPIIFHLKDAGVGYISEIFDGDPPHRPKGCIAQAWSVAELLRVLKEEMRTAGD